MIQEGHYMPYDRSHNDYARINRGSATSAEGLVRHMLLKQRPYGYKFTRQKPLGPFIADFYCSKLKLVIEIDGSSHDDKVDYDMKRTALLQDYGLSVIRYSNDDVRHRLQGVYEDLGRWIGEHQSVG